MVIPNTYPSLNNIVHTDFELGRVMCTVAAADPGITALFQPNFGVFGIDLSGGECWGLPMSNRYSHQPSKKCDFCRCKSRFSCVSAAFQLRFSSLEGFFSETSSFWSQNIRVPQSQTFLVFQLRFSWQKRGAHPLFELELLLGVDLWI